MNVSVCVVPSLRELLDAAWKMENVWKHSSARCFHIINFFKKLRRYIYMIIFERNFKFLVEDSLFFFDSFFPL